MVDTWDDNCISETSGLNGEGGRIKSFSRVNYVPWDKGIKAG